MNLIIVIHKMFSDTPISWNEPSNADNPQAGYGYIPNDTKKEETFFYHSDHLAVRFTSQMNTLTLHNMMFTCRMVSSSLTNALHLKICHISSMANSLMKKQIYTIMVQDDTFKVFLWLFDL